MTETLTGTNRSAGVSYAELLDQDTHPVSDVLRRESPMTPGNTRVPAKAYYSREWHDLEVEKLWSKTWQMVCLEDEIPEVGDYHVYDIAHLSFLVVRSAPNEIKAYRNACLHRGRKLRECDGRGAKNLRCPFHGWSWHLDGGLKEIPCEWDFPEIDKNFYDLPEAKVGTWQGFVFINPDRDAEPLSEYLKGLDEHFTHLPFTKRQKVAHVAKIMPVNWKACAEAFMEAYHVVATHPTLMVDMGDANSRYDVYGNYSRAISPRGTESPHLANMRHWDQLPDGRHFARWRHPMSGFIYEREGDGLARVIDHDDQVSIFTEEGVWVSGPLTQADPHMCKWVGGPMLEGLTDLPMLIPTAPDGVTNLRAHMAEAKRTQLREKFGPDAIDLDNVSDAELVDAIFYSVFPNWSPWGCFHELMYRWRPNGDNPDECIYEVMKFAPAPNGHTAPPAKVRHLGIDDDWTLAPELGPTAKIFQQDSINLPWVQQGLKAQEQQEVILASYGEGKLRHFWEHMFKVLGIENQPVSVKRK